MIQNVEDKCNSSNECILIENLIPKIILVPHTKGRDSQNIIDNFLNIISINNIELVHFTHYSWLLSFPEEELKTLLSTLVKTKKISSLKKIVIDTPRVMLFENLLKKITTS
jgi:hypothetical protein